MAMSITQTIVRSQLEAGHGLMDSWFTQSSQDPTSRADFYSVLAQSELFVLESATQDKGQIYAYTKNGKTMVPVFTSVNQIRPFILGSQLNRYRRLKTTNLMSLISQSSDLILNPKSKFAKVFSIQDLSQVLRSPQTFHQVHPVVESAVTPPTLPEDIAMNEVSVESSAKETISEAVTKEISREEMILAPVVETKKKSAVVVRRQSEGGFPHALTLALNNFCKMQSPVETAYLARDDNKYLIALVTDWDTSVQVDAILSELALSLDPAIAQVSEAVEICLLNESAEMKGLIESQKARQIYLRA